VEEHTLPAKVIIAHMNSLSSIEHAFPYSVSHVYDYEFKLIAALDFDLIIFHPYRPMMQYCADANFTDLLATSWPILNDSYLTDACLMYPPYLIAIACIYLAGTLADKDMRPWVTTLSVSSQDLSDLAQYLASMYSSPLLVPAASSHAQEALVNKLHFHFALRLQQTGVGTAQVCTPSTGAKAAGSSVNAPALAVSTPVSKRPPSGTKK
jgi:hypothetical protein